MGPAGVMLARWASSAWVGAAILVLVVGITEIQTAKLDPAARDRVILVRFPIYYTGGAILLTLAITGVLVAGYSPSLRRSTTRAAFLLLGLSFLGLILDYYLVYSTLADLMFSSPPGKPRSPTFQVFHRLSTVTNCFHLGLCLFASGMMNWPGLWVAGELVAASQTPASGRSGRMGVSGSATRLARSDNLASERPAASPPRSTNSDRIANSSPDNYEPPATRALPTLKSDGSGRSTTVPPAAPPSSGSSRSRLPNPGIAPPAPTPERTPQSEPPLFDDEE